MSHEIMHSGVEYSEKPAVDQANEILLIDLALKREGIIPVDKKVRYERTSQRVIERYAQQEYDYIDVFSIGRGQDLKLTKAGSDLTFNDLGKIVYDSKELKSAIIDMSLTPLISTNKTKINRAENIEKDFLVAKRTQFLEVLSLKADTISDDLNIAVIREFIDHSTLVKGLRDHLYTMLPPFRNLYERDMIAARIGGIYTGDRRSGGEYAERLLLRAFELEDREISENIAETIQNAMKNDKQ